MLNHGTPMVSYEWQGVSPEVRPLERSNCYTAGLRMRWGRSMRQVAAGGAHGARQPGYRAVTRARATTAYITSALRHERALVGSHHVESHISGVTAVQFDCNECVKRPQEGRQTLANLGAELLRVQGVTTAYVTSALHHERALVEGHHVESHISGVAAISASSDVGGASDARQPRHRAITRAGVATAYITSALPRKRASVESHRVDACIRGGNGVYTSALHCKRAWVGNHHVESHISGITAVPLGCVL